ncbi:sigma-70 family RNA polymerase sigma factor [candidate division KSB1 bacterium]|nr:sigma-70 family RNA polymerase sigma factor [candidate division KSB1 bacterium]
MMNAQRHRIEKSFEAERKGLFAFIRSKIRSLEESEDLLQDIYVQALGNLNVLDTVDNLTGWLYTVAKNRIIDWYRKKRLPVVSIDEVDENGRGFKEFLTEEIPEGLDEDELNEIYQIIFRYIEELPEKQQYVFIQQVVEGRTFRELADETGESINTLIARKQYATKFLKNKLNNLFNQ